MDFGTTLFIGLNRIHLKTVDSTNNYATTLLSKSKPSEGTVIIAEQQTAGRGQMGSKWFSNPDKSATFSILLYPHFLAPKQQFYLNKTIALGISDALMDLGVEKLKLKWPNDLYIGNGKVGGVLIQNSISSKKIYSTIVGIGINVHESNFAPTLPNPISLHQVLDKVPSIKALIDSICLFLEKRYLQLRNGSFEALNKDYQNRLYRYQQRTKFTTPQGNTFEGTIIGTNEEGKLLIESTKGLLSFGMKEIFFGERGTEN